MFAREGLILIATAAVLAVILVIVGFQLSMVWRVIFCAFAALILAFTLYFFRDPERTAPIDAAERQLILAPADGKVVVVDKSVHDSLYIHGPAKQISIFLSPLNVHVNRIPVDGVVEYVNYVPGDYLVAWHPKASELNEHSEIGVRHPSGTKILFKQIAGAVARRIVYNLEEGDTVVAGERFGIVKFGSRMDVLVPPHIVIDAEVGDVVVAGETILGHIPMHADSAAVEPAAADSAAAEPAAAETTATNTSAEPGTDSAPS